MAGVAEGAGVLFWTIAALNARTEILAEAGAPRAGECSTLVHSGTRTTGGQCWDWHEELAAAWHIQTVSGGTRNVAGITEYGILAKIGVNDAGVGVLFNILGHWDDAATGVPVHSWPVTSSARPGRSRRPSASSPEPRSPPRRS